MIDTNPAVTECWPELLQHQHFVQQVLMRRGCARNDVEDQVQDTFERVLRSGIAAREVGSWRALLRRVAGSVVSDAHRRSRARAHDRHLELSEADELADDVASTEDVIDQRRRLRKLKAALLRLDQQERDVIILARMDGLSHKTIGERLGIDAVQVGRILYKAVGKLAAEVDKC